MREAAEGRQAGNQEERDPLLYATPSCDAVGIDISSLLRRPTTLHAHDKAHARSTPRTLQHQKAADRRPGLLSAFSAFCVHPSGGVHTHRVAHRVFASDHLLPTAAEEYIYTISIPSLFIPFNHSLTSSTKERQRSETSLVYYTSTPQLHSLSTTTTNYYTQLPLQPHHLTTTTTFRMRSSTSPISPSTSIRRVKAAFSPMDSPIASYSDVASRASSRAQSPSRFSTASNFSSLSLGLRAVRSMIRRKPSTVELELEEERRSCADQLMTLVEPRPISPAHLNGIEEVIFGRL